MTRREFMDTFGIMMQIKDPDKEADDAFKIAVCNLACNFDKIFNSEDDEEDI